MIKGVGTDIIEIERIKNAGENFNKRIFTERELQKFHGFRYNSLAGIFAAKEAIAKALGTGFSGFAPKDIEIAQDRLGRPICLLSGGAKERLEFLEATNVHISISHNNDTAVAFAVVE